MDCDDTGFRRRMAMAAERAGNASRLARASGISRRAIGDYLAGSAEPVRSRLLAMARAAGVSVGWLAAGEGSGPSAAGPAAWEGFHQVVTDALLGVEEYLAEQQMTLAADKKAELVAQLCRLAGCPGLALEAEVQDRVGEILASAKPAPS